MSTIELQPETKERISPKVDVKIQPDVESQVIVHCVYFAGPTHAKIRIWPSTFLIDRESGHRSKLVHSENIAKYPSWQPVLVAIDFTLIFEGLPKSCKAFDLLEDIPEPGGLSIKNIKRNGTDVYRVPLEVSLPNE